MIICDASPLIVLAQISKLELLDKIWPSWWVPAEVFRECVARPEPFTPALESFLRAHVRDIGNSAVADTLSLLVDRGEAEAIVLAEQMGIHLLLIDDRKGRRLASLRGLEVVGTLGLFLIAKKRGYIDAVRPYLDDVRNAGLRISDDLVVEVLRIAGEYLS